MKLSRKAGIAVAVTALLAVVASFYALPCQRTVSRVQPQPGPCSKPLPPRRPFERDAAVDRPSAALVKRVVPEVPPAGGFGDANTREREVSRLARQSRADKQTVTERAMKEGWDPAWKTDSGSSQLMAIKNGKPYVFITHNREAAISIGVDQVRNVEPFNLSGRGETVGLWDAGHPLGTHQELAGRISVMDPPPYWQGHSTHVGGTIGASGVIARATGMAPAVRLDCYDWFDDFSEMASRAMALPGETDKIQISNHSYGPSCGWTGTSPHTWYGTWGLRESDSFGMYDSEAAELDGICWNAPYYLPFLSSGNDRWDSAPAEGQVFYYYDGGSQLLTNYNSSIHPSSDSWDNGGYDTIPLRGSAKNVVTVGCVNDAVSAGRRSVAAATMTAYSSWGPADDGRVKPDLVANGDTVYSCYSSGSSGYYTTQSGSSMSVAAASGGAILLTEYHSWLFTNRCMLASTIKGLMINSADDLGATGPDYRTGWGLINIAAACGHLRRHAVFPELGLVREDSLGGTNTIDSFVFTWTNSGPIKVTLCWTDPAGTPLSGLDNPTPALVNDLDLRVIDPLGNTNFPYVLDPAHPTNAATTGDNMLDNVELVSIASPSVAGVYVVTVASHGAISGSEQKYSLLVGGVALLPRIEHVPLENTIDEVGPYTVDADIVTFYGLETNSPAVLWNTTGSTSVFATNLMQRVTNNAYRAEIPGFPRGTAVYYYIAAGTTNSLLSASPVGAPATLHCFKVVNNVSFRVSGSPNAVGVVEPGYGTTFWPSGNVVHASAELYDTPANGHRHRCRGWGGGLGDVPAMGSSNSVSFRISGFSALTWRWGDEYSLSQTSSVPGIVSTQTWWAASSTGHTVTAQARAVMSATNYCFAEWRLDGARIQDAAGVSVNPVTGILMNTGRTAVAGYLPESLDADADGLPDWWEVFHFGSTVAGPGDDSDGDGYSNLAEFLDCSDPRDAGSTPEPPEIHALPPADPMTSPAPWRVEAAITDNCSIASATLFWRKNGEPTNCLAEMTAGGAAGVYAGTIPAPGTNGDSFECWIIASDPAGNTATSIVYRFDVAYPVEGLSPALLPVIGLFPGASTNITIILTNSGLADLVWRLVIVAAGLEDNIESGTNQWTHYGTNDLWHITSRRSVSSNHAWYCGLDASGLYVDSMNASLVTPPLHLCASPVLTFSHWSKTEIDEDLPGHSWDGGIVEVSTDGGSSFEQVMPVGGYNYLITPNPASPFEPETPCFGGTGEWLKATFDLSEYGGKTALMRFRFGSDAFVTNEGWYIDEVVVVPGTGTNDWLDVSPTNGVLAPGGTTNLTVALDSAGLANGSDVTALLVLFSNDPVTPVSNVVVSLSIRTPPEVMCGFAAQTSTNGEGYVTISNRVSDADGSLLWMEIMYSTNSGAAWDLAFVRDAGDLFGSVGISNGAPPQVFGIATKLGEALVTNRVSTVWNTTSNSLAMRVVTNAIMRTRAWDGFFWSIPATSQPFMVDNEPPGMPSGSDSPTHSIGVWSTNNVVTVSWLNHAGDGSGGGLSGYGYVFTNTGTGGAPASVMTTGKQMTSQPLADGSNWWLHVRAMDVFGNAGSVTGAGPYLVDTLPPDANSATVTILHSAFGAYIVGSTTITGTWSGFIDAGSGIAGYYYSSTNGGSSTGGWWTTEMICLITGLVMNTTNRVYVWAKDSLGHIGGAAGGNILVLAPDGDWDGDLQLNWQEEVAGSDAANPASVFKITGASADRPAEGYRFRLEWTGIAGRLYTVYFADRLGNPWTPDGSFSNIPSAGGMMIYTNNAPLSNRFFRVRASMP